MKLLRILKKMIAVYIIIQVGLYLFNLCTVGSVYSVRTTLKALNSLPVDSMLERQAKVLGSTNNKTVEVPKDTEQLPKQKDQPKPNTTIDKTPKNKPPKQENNDPTQENNPAEEKITPIESPDENPPIEDVTPNPISEDLNEDVSNEVEPITEIEPINETPEQFNETPEQENETP